MGTLIAWIVFMHLEQKTRLGLMKKYVKIKISVEFAMPTEKNKILRLNQ